MKNDLRLRNREISSGAIIENLEAVRTGCMWKDPKTGEELLRRKLIRVNKKKWFDITPAGRKELETRRKEDYGDKNAYL